MLVWRLTLPFEREDDQTVALRGSKSRNKVSVGEPAEGSLEDCLNDSFSKKHGTDIHTICQLVWAGCSVVFYYSRPQACLPGVPPNKSPGLSLIDLTVVRSTSRSVGCQSLDEPNKNVAYC